MLKCLCLIQVFTDAGKQTCAMIFRGPGPASLASTVNSVGLLIIQPDFSKPGPYARTYTVKFTLIFIFFNYVLIKCEMVTSNVLTTTV